MKEQNDTHPTRKSTRLPSYNYATEGAYFVTICVQDRQKWFDALTIHSILENTWQSLPQHFLGITLDSFVIMPDHIHFIVWLHPTMHSRPKLGAVVGAYKSLTAKAILHHLRETGKNPGEKLWQRGYIEHIIRNDFELEQRRLYILNNPIKDALKHNRLPYS